MKRSKRRTIVAARRSYFVSAAGDNGADGLTPATAWLDLTNPNARTWLPGDTLWLRGGDTFAGPLTFGTADAGTAGSPIEVTSYGTGEATITRSTAGESILVTNAGGYDIHHLILTGPGVNTGHSTQSNSGLRCLVNDGTVKSYLRIHHLDVSGFAHSGIHVQAGSETSGYTDVQITDNETYDNFQHGIDVKGVNGIVGWNHSNFKVLRNRSHHNVGVAGAGASGNGILLEFIDGVEDAHNVTYENGGLNTGAAGPCGNWAWHCNDLWMHHNQSHHNRTGSGTDGNGFDFDGGMTNSIMEDNESWENEGFGWIMYQPAGSREWANNIIRRNTSTNDGRKLNAGIGGAVYYSNHEPTSTFSAESYENVVNFDVAGCLNEPEALFLSFSEHPGVINVHDEVFHLNDGGGATAVPFRSVPASKGFTFTSITETL